MKYLELSSLWGRRQTVIDILDIMEPGRATLLRKSRLKRRVYSVKGPNHLWHIDGHDKLKRFGFCVHGAIDGFSRKVLWLEVARTNKNPELVAGYFVKAVKKLEVVPRVARMDRGTENFNLADLQKLLRYNHTDSLTEIAALFGSSNHNQRIERFWGILRKTILQIYMDIFQDMECAGVLDLSKDQELECLVFCFINVVRSEVAECMAWWNRHRIRKCKSASLPGGIPEHLYFSPEFYGYSDQGQPVDFHVLNHEACRHLSTFSHEDCNLAFQEWAYQHMLDYSWSIPRNRFDALELYGNLVGLLRHHHHQP